MRLEVKKANISFRVPRGKTGLYGIKVKPCSTVEPASRNDKLSAPSPIFL